MNALPKIAQKMTRHLLGVVLLTGFVLPLAVRAADVPPTGNAVQSVETTAMPGGKVVVRVNLKNALTATPAGFTVGNPPRIALDLPDTGNAMGRNTVEANVGPLASVNVVQAGTRTRLVLNLNKSVEYDARIEGKSLLVAGLSNSEESRGRGCGFLPLFSSSASVVRRELLVIVTPGAAAVPGFDRYEMIKPEDLGK